MIQNGAAAEADLQRCHTEVSLPAPDQEAIRRSCCRSFEQKGAPESLRWLPVALRSLGAGRWPTATARLSADRLPRFFLPRGRRIVSWPDAGSEPSTWLRCGTPRDPPQAQFITRCNKPLNKLIKCFVRRSPRRGVMWLQPVSCSCFNTVLIYHYSGETTGFVY